jgi:GntR family transcriptional regulator
MTQDSTQLLHDYQLRKADPKPLYVQMRDILKDLINRGRLRPGDRMPSENELARIFDISRMTVRQSLQELVREDVIQTRKGEGTFVLNIPHTQELFKLQGFSAEMNRLGYTASSRILKIKAVTSYRRHELAYSGLGVEPGLPLVLVRRVRYLNETPFAVETSYLPQSLGDELLKDNNLASQSIYGYLEHVHQVRIQRVDHSIQPSLAKPKIAHRLSLEKGAPVLRLRGTSYDGRGSAIEYLEGLYRGEPYELKIVLKNDKD